MPAPEPGRPFDTRGSRSGKLKAAPAARNRIRAARAGGDSCGRTDIKATIFEDRAPRPLGSQRLKNAQTLMRQGVARTPLFESLQSEQ
jgi:hypothetical protein